MRASRSSPGIRPVARRSLRIMASSPASMSQGKMKVIVTGAGGRTGSLIMRMMWQDKKIFDPYGVVRSEASTRSAVATGVPQSHLYTIDTTGPNAVEELTKAFQDKDAVVLATSSVPKLKVLSLLPVFWRRITNAITGGKENLIPEFEYPPGGTPEIVDWIGAKNQIDAAAKVGIKHFVFIGSMGGTDPDNFLNKLGNGNVLQWKRKAELHLLKSGLHYTIIHPGGLTDDAGGTRPLLLGKDDTLQKSPNKKVPRADVATVCLWSLVIPEAVDRSFDLSSAPEGSAPPTNSYESFAELLKGLDGNCNYDLNKEVVNLQASASAKIEA